MTNFITVSQAPKTKLQLKKAILNGSILVFEKDMNRDEDYKQIDANNIIKDFWNGFRFAPKYQGESSVAYACLGTSFYYKFKTK
jgi:hypothetical protein